MNATDIKVKVMQILEIVKKHAEVEIFMKAPKAEDEDKIVQKLQSVKNMLGNSVRILQDITQKIEEEATDKDEEE